MKVHLVDGTYELFRAYYGAPSATGPDGREVGAVRGLMRSLLSLLVAPDVTHVACAFDHVIESFRNTLFDGYKTSDGVPRDLLAQFTLAERATHALGMVVWSMVEFEADDALATGAARFADEPGVEQVVICTPDKDLAQCVRGTRVVMFDRRRRILLDEGSVKTKFGVLPESIPDWLALVGDDADGYPGLPGWGRKTAATVLSRYRRLEDIPDGDGTWGAAVRAAPGAVAGLRDRRADAFLYRSLARLRTDVPLTETLDDLRWTGSRRTELESICAEIGEGDVAARMPLWRDS